MVQYQINQKNQSESRRILVATFEEIWAEDDQILQSLWKYFRERITKSKNRRLHPSKDFRSIPFLRRVHHKFHILKDLVGKNHQSQKGFEELKSLKERPGCEDQVSYNFFVLGEKDYVEIWIEPSDSLIP